MKPMHEKQKSGKAVYQARFSWKNNRIYDGDKVIATFHTTRSYGLELRGVVLRPGEESLVDWLIGWRAQFVGATSEIDKISASEDGPKLELEFISHTPDKRYASNTKIVLSYDKNLRSYVYDVATTLVMNKFPFRDWSDFCKKCNRWYREIPLEFANINPCGDDSWQAWIYKDVEGNWTRVYLTHLWLPGFYGIQFNRKRAVAGLFDCAGRGNPVIELLGNTPARSKGDLCWAAFDMHFKCAPNMYARRHWAKYRLLCYDEKHSKDIVRQAKSEVYTPEELEVYMLPRFLKRNDFTRGIDITRSDRGTFWLPYGDVGCSKWSRTGGYRGKGCIRTVSKTRASTKWMPLSGRYDSAPKERVLFAYVKTENLQGEGAYLWFAGGKGKMCASKKLTGDNNWTKLTVTIPAGVSITPILQHKGKGCSIFSNVGVEEVKNK